MPPKKKNQRTPEEEAQVIANRANKGKTIGQWSEEQMKQAVER